MKIRQHITLSFLSNSSQSSTLQDLPSSGDFCKGVNQFCLEARSHESRLYVNFQSKDAKDFFSIWLGPSRHLGGTYWSPSLLCFLFSVRHLQLRLERTANVGSFWSKPFNFHHLPFGRTKLGWCLGIWNSGHKLHFNCELFYVWCKHTFF